MGIHDIVRDRIAEHQMRRRRGQTEQPRPDIDDAGITFIELPVTAAVLRAVALECGECHSLVLRSSSAAHIADHVRTALEQHAAQLLPIGDDAASGRLPDPDPAE